MIKKNYIILSGGTGGHVIPAVNFGNFIIEKGHDCSLLVDERGKKYADSFKGRVRIINSSHFSHNFLSFTNIQEYCWKHATTTMNASLNAII